MSHLKRTNISLTLQKGITSPRAFVEYDHSKDPEPKYFQEILQNSLSKESTKKFCEDFLALFRPKRNKQPVPCAIGAADSGKTSLFLPVFQKVPLNRIARVTKQKNFNKAMIDKSTEVIFLDQAFVGLLDADDWQIICQGGFTSHDSKWKKAEGFNSTATMYITCQAEMDIGAGHKEAMERRLNKYFFKSHHVLYLRQTNGCEKTPWSALCGRKRYQATPHKMQRRRQLCKETACLRRNYKTSLPYH